MRLVIQKGWPYFLVGFLYVCTSPYHRGLNNPNEMVRIYMSKAMVDDGGPAINQVVAEWGGVDDKAVRADKLYSSKAPLQSLFGVPAYAMAKQFTNNKRMITHWLRLLGSVGFGLGLAFILLAWCRQRALKLSGDANAGTGLGLSLALGTMIYPYSLTFTGHVLAALTAGGCYLAIVAILQRIEQDREWFRLSILAGLCGGAAPFAEYPAALVAAPALVGGLISMPNFETRKRLFAGLALGGLPPFLLGLWAHDQSWGAFYKTGYSFLENQAYVQVHGAGFFGVRAPNSEAFFGSLFSPGTGLFFYSPVLLIGLFVLLHRLIKTPSHKYALGRNTAIIAIIGFALELLFISGHSGWRGGWTLGPRYIIAVVPLLGVWLAEGLAYAKLRPWINFLGALSIILTGLAAALYPHLSDVYSNPLASFVLPSYLRGEFSYGLAHAAGLNGHLANLLHLIPLAVAVIFLCANSSQSRLRAFVLAGFGLFLSVFCISLIPENNTGAAMRENERLWGFWEPSRQSESDGNAVYRARDRWRQIQVEAQLKSSVQRRVACRRMPDRCEYGGQTWQHFKPDFLPFNGKHRSVLFIHPITNWTIRARMSVPRAARSAELSLGLADASADSDNQTPVHIRILDNKHILQEFDLPAERGLKTFPITLPAKTPKHISIEFECERDGARVLGFDLRFFETETSASP